MSLFELLDKFQEGKYGHMAAVNDTDGVGALLCTVSFFSFFSFELRIGGTFHLLRCFPTKK
jgi:hypothetical protein